MNLNFIHKKSNLILADSAGKNILELCADKGSVVYRAYDYNPGKNTISEISQEIKKYRFISVVNCIYGSESFYFATCTEKEDGIKFSVYEYDFSAGESECVFKFYLNKDFSLQNDKIKIFILNASNFLVQTETLTPEDASNLMGVISFNLTLYNTETRESSQVDVPDFKNNGINVIIPVSENTLVVKCGYSFIEDERFNMLAENEALIESVYITSTARFLADISMNATTGNLSLTDTAYFEKCITTPKAEGNFIYYEIIDIINKSVDINFININTLARFTYKKSDDEPAASSTPLVIKNTPYIRISQSGRERFLNLTNGLEDMEFTDESFVGSCADLLIFSKKRRKKEYLRFYCVPSVEMIYEESCSFGAICSHNNEYYIYIE